MQNFPLSNCKVGENFAYPRGRQNLIFVIKQNPCLRLTGCITNALFLLYGYAFVMPGEPFCSPCTMARQ